MLLNILLWCLFGLIAGTVAQLIMPGKDPGGIIVTMLLGIAGSLLATFIGVRVGWYQAGDKAGFIMSVVGAIALLAIYRVSHKKTA